jgi:hypothetical protein
MTLTKNEILLVLKLMEEKYGPGYAKDPLASRLQAKLSIMLEVRTRMKSQDEPE